MSNPITGAVADVGATAANVVAWPTVAGAQVAALGPDGKLRSAAAGLRDVDAPAAVVSEETRFRPGSIAKLITATLVMQCVDDGLVGLDDPVTRYVPPFRLSVDGAASAVQVRHLLAHSSGIDAGDLFVDTGDDDGAIGRYVALLSDVGLLFEPGRWMSYCNAGFVLAGHLVETVREAPWEEVARRRVFEPLGMCATTFATGRETDAAADAGGNVARGHLAGPSALAPVPQGTLSADPMCTRALGPAGATLSSTATDLARFVAAHLGVHGGPSIVSAASAEAMRALHAPAPGGVTRQAGAGFAWQMWRGATPGEPMRPRIGGANPGQSGVVACDPLSRSALVVLTNSDQGVNAVNLILDGFGPAAVPDDDPAPDDLSVYAGRYRSHVMAVEVRAGTDGRLQLVVSDIAEARVGAMRIPGVAGELTYDLDAVDRTTFRTPIGPVAFIDRDESGRPRILRWRMRAHRRVQ